VHLTPPRATIALNVERLGIMLIPVLRGTPGHPCAEPADATAEEWELDPAEQQGTTKSGPRSGESCEC
jgi:hypothetical protein